MVVLVGPNTGGIENIGRVNLKNVILFKEILEELGDRLDIERIQEQMKQDLEKSIEIFQKPVQGNRINQQFLRDRESMRINNRNQSIL